MKKIIVTGGRNFYDWGIIYQVLNSLDPEIVVQGGASGADQIARAWAEGKVRL